MSNETTAAEKNRYSTINMHLDGKDNKQIAEELGISLRRVQMIIKDFKKYKLDKYVKVGRPSILASQELTEINEAISKKPYESYIPAEEWTPKLLSSYIHLKLGKKIEYESARILLNRFNSQSPTSESIHKSFTLSEWTISDMRIGFRRLSEEKQLKADNKYEKLHLFLAQNIKTQEKYYKIQAYTEGSLYSTIQYSNNPRNYSIRKFLTELSQIESYDLIRAQLSINKNNTLLQNSIIKYENIPIVIRLVSGAANNIKALNKHMQNIKYEIYDIIIGERAKANIRKYLNKNGFKSISRS
ncbi:MAG: hypothetical protein WBL93_10495 [Lutisporaceae bacterium]